MHKWASLQKLIKAFEDQTIKDPFVYEAFQFNSEEWDNVPEVIPRF